MNQFSRLSFAFALALGLATAAQASNNPGCTPNPCGNGGGKSHHGGGNGGGGNGGCGGTTTTLRCDAGGPYVVASAPGSVSIQLDGSGSTGGIDFVWNTTYPGAYFNDASLPNPTLVIPVTSTCGFDVPVELLLKSASSATTCSTVVRVRDREKPVITCPELAKVISGESTSPDALGWATATDNCDQNVTITYHDRIILPECRGDRFAYQIERKWKAVDDDCNVERCIQIIDVVRRSANIDVLPGVCPNTYDPSGCGYLAIAIAGEPGFNANQIKWNSIKLWGYECSAGPLSPDCLQLCDVATPFPNGFNCNCTTANGDGKVDLVARFKRSRINNAFGLCNVPAGTAIRVVVTGKLQNGNEFAGLDCFIVQ